MQIIGNLDIILAVHYIIREVVSSGCLARGTFSAQMELMVYWGGRAGGDGVGKAEEREGPRERNRFHFWTHQ